MLVQRGPWYPVLSLPRNESCGSCSLGRRWLSGIRKGAVVGLLEGLDPLPGPLQPFCPRDLRMRVQLGNRRGQHRILGVLLPGLPALS